MNLHLTWTIVKKDLSRTRLALCFWVLTGACLSAYPQMNVRQGTLWDNFGIFCFFTHIAVALTLIAAFVQEDNVTETNVFWRTRPISTGRLLAAKLGLSFALFVVVPVLVFAVLMAVDAVNQKRVGALFEIAGACSVWVLCSAAVASCSKDLGRYFLTGAVSVFCAGSLGSYFTSLREQTGEIGRNAGSSKIVAMMILCGLVASVILYLQYFKRWRVISYLLIGMAVVGSSLIGAFWTWRFLP